ncbi:transcriptional regulator, LysR family protein [Sphaerotilus natans subsp. natans DSM 6575]|uniref:Transcriptional regulator, LysR family protein n=1 Tax=Sphaerotilus natans subsp. natans DSM 6575 TaxID=1286631 RepID=A0A059KNK6_9BURK|nr:LysR family transcriptional regulator [Sphaerotilus natans]KDB52698.1 transcriptional regulator, LysR family protein [Sphaerotilus natans subsp. natans DSM 6575]SIQ49829.1 DNA-binding transcriptional regulator, LysR family [Sphaerotilus natans]
MDIQALNLLVEIIDCGNLSQVARKFKMTRANVSYHLAQLEKQTGVQLVRRTTRRVEPTEVGLRLYEHGRNIQNEMRAAQETITSLGQGLQGRVGISVPSGYGQMVMSHWLIDFKTQYPGIVLDVVFENRVDNLRDDVDIAVRILPEPPQQLVARDMGTVRYLACAARTYADAHGLPTQLAQLGTLPLVTANVVGRQLSLRGYRGTEREEIQLAPSLISDHYPFLRQCVLAGLGLGLLPDYVVQDVIATGEVVTALDDYRLSIFGTRMYLLTLPNRHQTRAVRTCIDFLLARAKGKPPDHDQLGACRHPG